MSKTGGNTELDLCIDRATVILYKINNLYNDLHGTAVRLVGEAEVKQHKLILGALEEIPQGKLYELFHLLGAIANRVEYIEESVEFLSSRL